MISRLALAILSSSALAGCVAVFPVTLQEPTPAQYTEAPTQLTVEIGPDMVPCQGAFPQRCMIVNGEYFYDQIDGFTHVPGRTTTAEIERAQRCDPAVLNSCPQDVGIYSYRLIRVISER